jgi:acyl transferase domain-containing protein/NADPH:quinone reductase-like Zn-dependent oxidoreductase/SAM-dependent methyltransferase/acyl carrier protein
MSMKKIAIIGAACRLPGGVASLDGLWEVLASGRDAVTEIPADRFDIPAFLHPQRTAPGRSCTFAAGVLDGVADFDFSFFGISKKEAEYMDPQQRLLLELAWEVLEDAHVPPSSLAGSDTAVFIGSSSLDASMQRADDPCVIGPYSMIGNTLGLLANRVSYLLDLHGPSMTIDTACSASLVALHQACQAMLSGQTRMALVGGMHILCSPLPFVGFSKAHMLSKDGRCRVFAKNANGYVRSEGGGLLLLKPLDAALADGDRIHAVIAKTGVNTDGRTIGIAFPNQDAQMALLRSLYGDPALDLRNVCYMEAHGTGTAAGDPVEARSIGEVFSDLRPSPDPLLVGSVKSNLGHLEPASGIAGLLKAMLVLKHKTAPPCLHLAEPNPDIDCRALGIAFVTEPTPLPATPGPALVGVNSFGFGGANAHALLEAAPAARPPSDDPAAPSVPPLLLSAHSHGSLRRLAARYAELLSGADAAFYRAVASRAALRRDHLNHRVVIEDHAVPGVGEALARLAASDAFPLKDPRVVAGDRLGGVVRTAFVYSGNGGHWAGMGQALFASDRLAAAALDEVDAVMAPLLGWSPKELLLSDPSGWDLTRIDVVQPLLFTIQAGLTRALAARGVTPDMVFGHSIGEVAAAFACGALPLDQAALVVVARSALQRESRGLGDMAVVQMSEKDALDLPEVRSGELEIAAVNSARYATLTGKAEALESVRASQKKRRAVFRHLNLGHPFHSRAMEGIRERLCSRLAGVVRPEPGHAAFLSTVDGRVRPGTDLDAAYWWQNLRRPVRFRDAALAAMDHGARVFIEIGPDALLQPFLKNCFQERSTTTVYLPSVLRGHNDGRAAETLWKKAHVHGARVDLSTLFPDPTPHVELPAYPFDREPCLAESTPECLDLFGAKPPAHPLLGRRARRGPHVWENTLDTQLVPFLADHVVGTEVVLPGAAYLEMALAAAREAYGPGSVELENVELRHPMAFVPGKARAVRFTLSAEGGDFSIESRELLHASGMTAHVTGRIVPKPRKTPRPVPCPDPAGSEEDVAGLYAKAVDSGLHFGPAFRPMRRVRRLGDVAVAELALTPAAEFPGAVLHPSLIDGAFQMLLSLVAWHDDTLSTFIYLPVRVGRLLLLEPGLAVRARATLARQSRRALAASFSLYDEAGRELARLEDCRFARVQTREGLLRQQHVYAVTVIPARHPLDASPSVLPGDDALAALTAPDIEALVQSPRHLRRIREAIPFFTALVLSQTMEALAGLAALGGGRREFTVAELVRHGGVPDGLAPYLAHALEFLERMDMAVRSGGRYRLTGHDLPPALELWRAALAAYPEHVSELALMGQLGQDLDAILRGEREAATLLSLRPGGAMENLFRDCPRHAWGHAAVAALLDGLLRAVPAGAGLRILEVEAGPGGLTQSLAPRLSPRSAQYVLADRDEHFVEQLTARFGALPHVTACLFAPDDPEAAAPEAVAEGGFDLILAAHALHRLDDPSQALARLHDLLRPGGMLVVLDSPPHPAIDLVFGLDPTWWREDGAGEGGPASRLMDRREWTACLARAGFLPPRPILCDDDGDVLLFTARKMVLPAQDAVVPVRKRWVFFEDAAPRPEARALSDALSGALRAAGTEPVRVTPGSEFAALPSGGFSLAPESPDQWKRLFTALGDAPPSLECVFLSGFDLRQDPGPDVLDDIQNRRVAGAVALARGWRKAKVPAGLCLVTGGGLPLPGQPSRPVPSQAALVGLGRVLANEMPGLSPRLVDIHAGPDGELPLAAAVREILCPLRDLLAPGQDDKEVALTPSGRFHPRLSPLETAEAAANPSDAAGTALTLEMAEQGRLDGAAWRRAAAPAPGPGQVLIENKAAGVNYRDIMFALGRIPEEALENGASGPTLGLECAGTVAAVGQGVTGMAPGDAVCCLSGGCYDSHVLADARAVFPMPRGVSPTAAATIPVAHFTAWYALVHLARLAPGERVLIHGAAGGVGLAAIQIAGLMGAEIFATAGSPLKRTLLTRLGVPHVFDSRSLDFEERIREITGGQGVDVVLNSISGEALQKSLGLLKPLGRFLELGKVDFYANSPLRMRLLRNNASFFGIDVDQVMRVAPDLCRRLFLEMLTRFDTKELWPLPHSVFPRAGIAEAFRAMQQSRHMGKLVVECDEAAAGARPMATPGLGPLAAGGCYLVTGGLGGLGLAVCGRLVRLGAKDLVLVGRKGAATDAQKAAVADLAARGARVTVVRADVADAAGLARALGAALADLPPLRGVVHCAGVLRDATIANLSAADIRTVLRAKALGGYNLHRLTRDVPLDFFIMFSSATTVLGNPGQANYVAANTVLENLAAYRRSLGLPGVTFGWGPISDTGMLASRPEVMQSLKALTGAQELRAETAMDHMAAYARHDEPNLHVFRVNFKKLARLPYVASPMYRQVIADSSLEQAAGEQVDLREALRGLAPKEAVQRLATMLSQHFARILRVPVSKIRHDKPMGELGMDSLMYVELGLATEETFGVDISALSLDKNASILTLAEMIHRHVAEPAGAASTQAEAVSRHLRDVHGVDLSPQDARRLLEGDTARSRPN